MKSFLVLITCATIVSAQTPTPILAGGIVYQVAAQNGISYISPSAGQAIINTKSALNWHTIASQVLGDGSIGILTAGLANVIHMGIPLETGLAAFHAYYDHSIAPVIAEATPMPGNLPPVLQVTSTIAPTAAACTENSIYATYNRNALTILPLTVTVQGINLTFSPQPLPVIKNAAGSAIKQMQIIDVLACLAMSSTVVSQPNGLVIAPEKSWGIITPNDDYYPAAPVQVPNYRYNSTPPIVQPGTPIPIRTHPAVNDTHGDQWADWEGTKGGIEYIAFVR